MLVLWEWMLPLRHLYLTSPFMVDLIKGKYNQVFID